MMPFAENANYMTDGMWYIVEKLSQLISSISGLAINKNSNGVSW